MKKEVLEIKNKDNNRKKEGNLTISKPSNSKRNKILKVKNSK
jgi:hypothetical protein